MRREGPAGVVVRRPAGARSPAGVEVDFRCLAHPPAEVGVRRPAGRGPRPPAALRRLGGVDGEGAGRPRAAEGLGGNPDGRGRGPRPHQRRKWPLAVEPVLLRLLPLLLEPADLLDPPPRQSPPEGALQENRGADACHLLLDPARLPLQEAPLDQRLEAPDGDRLADPGLDPGRRPPQPRVQPRARPGHRQDADDPPGEYRPPPRLDPRGGRLVGPEAVLEVVHRLPHVPEALPQLVRQPRRRADLGLQGGADHGGPPLPHQPDPPSALDPHGVVFTTEARDLPALVQGPQLPLLLLAGSSELLVRPAARSRQHFRLRAQQCQLLVDALRQRLLPDAGLAGDAPAAPDGQGAPAGGPGGAAAGGAGVAGRA
mmetsp:Transcript_111835/g.241141  ORF Transcript_111835/g.241141 Transcript_111835/m.241141 type:complete len:371 (+) Transcript_111835:744-1856(+)